MFSVTGWLFSRATVDLLYGWVWWRVLEVFTKSLAQADHSSQVKSVRMFQLPVFPCVGLITEHCQLIIQYSLFGVSLHAKPYFHSISSKNKYAVYVVHLISIGNLE